jgi:hypothetical protein
MKCGLLKFGLCIYDKAIPAAKIERILCGDLWSSVNVRLRIPGSSPSRTRSHPSTCVHQCSSTGLPKAEWWILAWYSRITHGFIGDHPGRIWKHRAIFQSYPFSNLLSKYWLKSLPFLSNLSWYRYNIKSQISHMTWDKLSYPLTPGDVSSAEWNQNNDRAFLPFLSFPLIPDQIPMVSVAHNNSNNHIPTTMTITHGALHNNKGKMSPEQYLQQWQYPWHNAQQQWGNVVCVM